MNDFAAEPPALRQAMLDAASRVLHSGHYVLGPEVRDFEAEWARICGTRRGIGVANGMDALEIALRAMGIGPGDEVITTGMTAFATVLAIHRAGATPVLADIDTQTALMDVESVRRCLSTRSKALILVHLYGQVRSMNRWVDLCTNAGIQLLEDCAQSHGALWCGRPCGGFGRAGAFSFYPTKNLGASGDAGMLVTNDPDLAQQAQGLRNYGQATRYVHQFEGLNSRLDELHAAMLRARLKWWPVFTRRRQEIACAYRQQLSNPRVTLLAPPEEEAAHVYHLFVVRSRQRESLMQHLDRRGIQSLIHYPLAAHQQPAGAGISCDPQGLLATETHARECLSLPCHPQMSDAQVQRVIQAINSFREE